MVAVTANAADNNPVLTIEGGQVQGVLADDHPDVFSSRFIEKSSISSSARSIPACEAISETKRSISGVSRKGGKYMSYSIYYSAAKIQINHQTAKQL